MAATQLPQEILQHIFQYLEDPFPYYYKDGNEDLITGSLFELHLTCKQWSQAAREVLYKKVNLVNKPEKASLFLNTLQSVSGLGHTVKELSFSDETFNNGISFSNIARLCPNLKVLVHQGPLEKVTPPSMVYSGNTLFKQYNNLMLAARKTITSLYISQATQYALAESLNTFVNLREAKFDINTPLAFHQLNSMLTGNHPLLESVEIDFITARDVNMMLRPISLQDIQMVQHMFPKVHNLYIIDLSLAELRHNVIINTLTVEEQNPGAVFENLFEYLSAISRFSIENIALSTNELLTALAVVSKPFQVDRVSIRFMPNQRDIGHHRFSIAAPDGLTSNLITRGGKPGCSISIKLNRFHQMDSLFCLELYKVLIQKTTPCEMAIIGSVSPVKQCLGDYIGYLLAHADYLKHLTLSDLSIDIPPIPETENPAIDLNLVINNCIITHRTLQELAKTTLFMDHLQLDNAKVLDTETNTLTNIMEVNLPQAIIGTLSLYDRRSSHSTNVIYKI
ncbi:hypothetical protein MBANPS3_010334 [Mucor bainieri]